MKTNNPEFLRLAYVYKAHGIKGEIFVQPLNPEFKWPHPIKIIFIGNSEPVKFSVKKYSHHKQGLIFRLEESQSRQSAEQLKSQSVFLPKSLFKSKKGENIYLVELISFKVEVLGQGKAGYIKSFQSDRYQDFLLVQRKSSSPISIPFVSAYIKDIDFSKKTVSLDLPKNFFEVFKYNSV